MSRAIFPDHEGPLNRAVVAAEERDARQKPRGLRILHDLRR
jgi:hypothetical protein